ncbi:MAG: aminoacyl-tRNA hydrolase [Calditrichia bacterium]
MYFIIGLGNPGPEYEKTRHNIGFLVLEHLGNRYHQIFRKGRGPFQYTSFNFKEQQVYLIKPLTYMNLSGQAVRSLISFYKIEDYRQMLVISDDINLPFGTLRLRPEGSDGGQKGLRSIIDNLKTREIPRLRIGIGDNFSDAANYVLSRFNPQEQKDLPFILGGAADAVESFMEKGVELTMSRYNKNILEP